MSARAAAVLRSLQAIVACTDDPASLLRPLWHDKRITVDAALCALMDEFLPNEDIQMYACGALLTGSISFFVPKRCIAAATRAMEAHPDCSMLQLLACGVLGAVGLHCRTWQVLQTKGSVGAVVTALTRHRTDACVVTLGLSVLCVATQDVDVCEALVLSGAADAVMEVSALAPRYATIVLARICSVAAKRARGVDAAVLLNRVFGMLQGLLAALSHEPCAALALEAGRELCGVLAAAGLHSPFAQAQLRTLACEALSAV